MSCVLSLSSFLSRYSSYIDPSPPLTSAGPQPRYADDLDLRSGSEGTPGFRGGLPRSSMMSPPTVGGGNPFLFSRQLSSHEIGRASQSPSSNLLDGFLTVRRRSSRDFTPL